MSKQTAELVIPTVHLNGTAKADLLKQYRDAGVAVNTALGILQDASPHGRDYYVQDSTGAAYGAPIQRAMEQHRSRMQRLESVYQELVALYEGVIDQGK